jgi:uncharacterized protein RhaS with RHS repeats
MGFGESGANWYAYVANNPLTNVDPTGLDASDFYEAISKAQKPSAQLSISADYSQIIAVTHPSPLEQARPLQPVKQNDPSMLAMFPDFAVGPCLAMSLIAPWEKTLGLNATPVEIAAIIIKAQSGNSPSLAKDYTVMDRQGVLDTAMSILPVPEGMTIKNTATKEGADYSIAKGKAPNGGPHYALGACRTSPWGLPEIFVAW